MGLIRWVVFLCVFWMFMYSGSVLSQTVRLITIGPGDAFWSVYGHTALAIDDQVYAFGYFDFADDSLIQSFIANDMRYEMGISNIDDELYAAEYYQRQFTEQILDLPSNTVLGIRAVLNQHYLPENRAYPYDYFDNNCATKIRDLINRATEGALLKRASELSPYSYAELTLPAYHQSAMRFGLALGYGYQAYKDITDWQSMAFPVAMKHFFSTHMSDYVVQEYVLYDPPVDNWTWFKNHAFYLVLLCVLLIAWIIKPLRHGLVISWFWLASLVGCVLLLLWFVLPHPIADGNFNVLLTNPLLFLAVLRRPPRFSVGMLMIGQGLWLGFAFYWQAWYLMPLAFINLLFLRQRLNASRSLS